MFLAYFFYQYQPAFLKTGTIHGQLITPSPDFRDLPLYNIDGSERSHDFQGRWILFYVTPLPCDTVCESHLTDITKVYKTFLDKDKSRMTLLVGRFSSLQESNFETLLQTQYPLFQSVFVDRKSFERLFSNIPDCRCALMEGALYIIDPHQNVVMVYDQNLAPRPLKKDLTKLLKVSQIG
jgi:peroxiredoxin